jgi:GNAT superfamily N-acetyltransferase
MSADQRGKPVTVVVSVAGEEDVSEARRVMSRVLEEDLGGFRERWHADVQDPVTAYVRADRSALFVARVAGAVVGTAAVRPCALQSPPNPAWLAERFSDPSVCELRRVWVPAEARRQGVAAALLRAAVRWATTAGGFRTVYLHTDTSAPGAEAFWRAMPTLEVHDCRPDPYNCVHFILDIDKLLDDVDR